MFGMHKDINIIFRATLIPGVLVFIWLAGLISIITLEICLIIFFAIFVIFPLIFRYSLTLQRGMLFLTFIRYPKGLDLAKPETLGLYATRNFYVRVEDEDPDAVEGVNIGVWHVLPNHLVKLFAQELAVDVNDYEDLRNVTEETDSVLERMEPVLKSEFPEVNQQNQQLFYERMLKLPGVIVLYLHGNTATRGSGHRSEIYKILRKLNYHVIAIDYRGYADSDPVSPTEEGVVRDAMAAYEYITNLTTNPVIIWGHSLGTGVATHLCAQLTHMNIREPRGVILESPFTNIREEIRNHPFSKPFRNLPWFDFAIANPMYANALRFESNHHIAEFHEPVMIIHAEDDYVVPFQLGYKLYRIALDSRGKAWGPVQFHRFDASHQYGHKYLCRSPELPHLVKNFIETYQDEIF